jgi:hypothetical protein
MSSAFVDGQADRIDVRIEVSFSRLDPPEGRAARVTAGDARGAVEAHSFLGWLGLLGVLQLLTDDGVEPPRP